MGVDMGAIWLYGTDTRPYGGHISMLSGFFGIFLCFLFDVEYLGMVCRCGDDFSHYGVVSLCLQNYYKICGPGTQGGGPDPLNPNLTFAPL